MATNILIIGNGFDLYHNLPTRYTDFLTLVDYWDDFYSEYQSVLGSFKIGCFEPNHKISLNLNCGKLTRDAVKEIASNACMFDKEHIDYLNKHLKTNKWIQYFNETGYKEEGWIDFEREIENVLLRIERYFSIILPSIESQKIKSEICAPIINDTSLDLILELFGDNIDLADVGNAFDLESNNQIDRAKQKNLLIHNMKNELDVLIICFRLYILEFVNWIEVNRHCDQIDKLGKFKLLTFNYTSILSEYYPNHLIEEPCYVHGNVTDNNMVMGIRDDFCENTDYIYFQKYFQRIQKRTGITYEKLLDYIDDSVTSEEELDRRYPEVYIMGHSLDKTDKGVLEKFIKAEYKVHIFYHDQNAYEQQVIRLVDMFGKERIIDAVANQEILFEELE